MLSNLLSQAEVRHKVISQNIANVNTPGYRSLQISFEETLRKTTEGAGSDGAGGTISESEGLTIRQDGNNVDVDRELGHLTKNALHFETYSQLLASKMAMLRSAITGQ